MCENREPINEIEAIRQELAALIELSNEKLEEMKQIQKRMDEVAEEITRLTEELDQLGDAMPSSAS